MRDGLRFLNLDSIKSPYDYKDKPTAYNNYMQLLLNRTNTMFTYTNLPPTLPATILEAYLQRYGRAAIIRVDAPVPYTEMQMPPTEISDPNSTADTGTTDTTAPPLYCFFSSEGSTPDIYYRPTECVIANPALPPAYNRSYKIGMDCVVIRNDLMAQGLIPLLSRYAAQFVEVDISLFVSLILSRQQAIITANDGREYDSAVKYLAQLNKGELGVIADRAVLEDAVKITGLTANHANTLNSIIDAMQYLKVACFNDLGIMESMSLKRQYVSAEEIDASNTALMPLVDNMLIQRQLGIDAVNKMFGTNITVKKSSAWAQKEDEVFDLESQGGEFENVGQDSYTE